MMLVPLNGHHCSSNYNNTDMPTVTKDLKRPVDIKPFYE